MPYELYYWPTIQGRGEFIRLVLEAAGADYIDVARGSSDAGQGVPALMRLLNDGGLETPPFAPPFLRSEGLVIAQTANILQFLAPRLGLAPEDPAARVRANQVVLTIMDFLVEAHDTHHPIASGLYYEDQKAEAKARAADFLQSRAPKYLGYFERVLTSNPAGPDWAIGHRLSPVDPSLSQIVEGMRYAFPRAMARLEKATPALTGLHDRVAEQPGIKAYLASDRRIPFNEQGIFRHYPELDG